MILVVVGTQDKPFTRLLEAVEKYAIKNPNEKIIVQAGHTKYESKYMEIHDFFTPEEMDKLYDECDLVICHGGVGTIMGSINHGKPVIAAARLSKYGEHTNDHQLQIIGQFAHDKSLLELKDFNELESLVKKAKTYKFNGVKSNNKNFTKLIEKTIDNYLK